MSSARVVVVGGGAVGLATACELAGRGAAVTVVDAEASRRATSRTSFARLNAAEKTRRDYFELNAAGMAAYRRFAAEHGPQPWLHLDGHLEWATTGEGREALAARAELVAGWGYSVEPISGRQARERLEPELRVADDEDVVFFPDEGHVETVGLLGTLRRRAASLGAVLVPGVVAGFELAGDEVRGVRLESGERLGADVVVCAAGRWTGELAELAGARVPLLAPGDPGASGFLAWTEPTTAAYRRSLFSPLLNVRPDGGGRLLLQAFELDEAAALDDAAERAPGLAGEFARRLHETLALAVPVEVEVVRVGRRALPADGLPIVGRPDGVEGLYVVVAHSGITLCLALGALAAAEVVSGREERLLDPFRPGRFARSHGRGPERV
ncbi:MAG TPA: FAD-dependent oxidoreductase [Gaiellaceae bacterium]|nr:FAD-dependent oxidoreductase [Gaiellaceae bacterium]